jgi:hypothetical protein
VKCAIVERSHRTIRDKLYKDMIYKNTYRYIDVLPKFIRGYNDTVHRATAMSRQRDIRRIQIAVILGSMKYKTSLSVAIACLL